MFPVFTVLFSDSDSFSHVSCGLLLPDMLPDRADVGSRSPGGPPQGLFSQERQRGPPPRISTEDTAQIAWASCPVAWAAGRTALGRRFTGSVGAHMRAAAMLSPGLPCALPAGLTGMAEHAAAFPLSMSEAANVRIATGHAARANPTGSSAVALMPALNAPGASPQWCVGLQGLAGALRAVRDGDAARPWGIPRSVVRSFGLIQLYSYERSGWTRRGARQGASSAFRSRATTSQKRQKRAANYL